MIDEEAREYMGYNAHLSVMFICPGPYYRKAHIGVLHVACSDGVVGDYVPRAEARRDNVKNGQILRTDH